MVLDRRSPVLHLMQKIRDESHRFAVTYHRKRREMRDRDSELLAIPGVGPRTRQRLLEHFGSLRGIRQAPPDALTAVVNPPPLKRFANTSTQDAAAKRAAACPSVATSCHPGRSARRYCSSSRCRLQARVETRPFSARWSRA